MRPILSLKRKRGEGENSDIPFSEIKFKLSEIVCLGKSETSKRED